MRLRNQIMILCVMGALFITSDSGAANTKNEIIFLQERLTAHVVDVSLKKVLSAVAKEAKLDFALNEAIATEKVSVWFDKLPLDKGIKRIVRPFSHSMIFDHSGRLKKVIILKSGSTSANVTISGGPHFMPTTGPSQEGFDPSLGPAGRLDEGVPPSGPGPIEGGMTAETEDFDPSLGPDGRRFEDLPPSGPGPGTEGEMTTQSEDFDPSLGPAGRQDEVLPPSAAQGGGDTMTAQPGVKNPTSSPKGP